MPRITSLALGFFAVLLFVLAGALGGPAFVLDAETVHALTLFRQPRPELTMGLVWLTHLGGATFLLPVGVAAAALLLWRGRARNGAWLLLTILGGRALVELLKWATDRPRPGFEAHPVAVASQAFPSGHAANSMITYLAIALFAVPSHWRGAAVAVALLLAIAIGLTRPILGVHWPTDVVGGWVLGGLWTMLLWRWSEARRLRSA